MVDVNIKYAEWVIALLFVLTLRKPPTVLSANGVWDERDGEALMAALHSELENALGWKLPAALWHQLIRERRATFTCRPNLPRPATQTPLPGLWLAGDYVCAGYPATLEGAVRSGVAAARGILGSA